MNTAGLMLGLMLAAAITFTASLLTTNDLRAATTAASGPICAVLTLLLMRGIAAMINDWRKP